MVTGRAPIAGFVVSRHQSQAEALTAKLRLERSDAWHVFTVEPDEDPETDTRWLVVRR